MRIVVILILSVIIGFLGVCQENQIPFNIDCYEALDVYPCFIGLAIPYLTEKNRSDIKRAIYKFRERDSSQIFIDNYANACYVVVGLCDKAKVDSRFLEHLNDQKMPDYIKNVFCEFCSRAYSNEKERYTQNEIISSYLWMKNEYFCMWSRYEANFLALKIKPYNKFGERLNNVSIELCDELRKNEISLYDAYYRYDQELNIMYDNVGKEYFGLLLESISKFDFSSLFK